SPQLSISLRDKSMRGAVKSEASNMMAAIQVIGKSVEVCVLRNGLMKRGVKNRYLRDTRTEHAPGRENAFDVVRVVERGQVDAFLNPLQHLVRDHGGL